MHPVILITTVFQWNNGSPGAELSADYFGTVAETSLPLPAGSYQLWSTSDDGIRIWLDGQLVIEDWTHHAPHEHSATVNLEKGVHSFRIEHFEITGHAQLGFRIMH
ncbi:MAG: PA14 domain-containing protein [Planctomycetota bacterium]